MASSTSLLLINLLFMLACSLVHSQQLSSTFYSSSCPNLQGIVSSGMTQAINKERRMGDSILRLFFHDCFVNLGGPTWTVQLGRRNSTTANQSAANSQIPSPLSSLANLTTMFANKGLSAGDLTALSGAHTIGQARCTLFRTHIYNESNIDPRLANLHRQNCPASGRDNNLAPLDVLSPNRFENDYYSDLVARRGLLHSDQELFNGGAQDGLVQQYSANGRLFASDFAEAMVKLGGISPLTGRSGEIRLNCRKVNS